MPPIKRRYLPSLGSFATFEVAAKHLSFTLAAKELNVTQGAVSQQIRILERERQLQAVPIVALTAHILEEHRAAGQAVGMDDFLGKPLDHQQLYAMLDHYLLAPARATD